MSSLFGTISLSLRALLAQQAALQTTADNISNINTPGYSRRRAVMVEAEPIATAELVVGNGVRIDRIESLRDRVLDLRIQEETQEQGELSGFLKTMQEVETTFSGVDEGIGADLDDFFNAVTRLSTDPTNLSLRQNVLTAADNLASALNATAENLHSQQQDIDRGLSQRVDEVNRLTSRIASLNGELSRVRGSDGSSGEFEDQRTEALKQLSALIGVSVVDADDGVIVTTADGAPLARTASLAKQRAG